MLDNRMNFTTYYGKQDSIELLKIDKLSRVKKVNSVQLFPNFRKSNMI